MDSWITSDLQLLAHRGYDREFPENTLLAFERASETADYIELDVQRCASGEIVVFHDSTLDRITDGTGAVRCTDWETIRDLEVHGSGQGVPLLSEAFEAVPDDVGLLIELKGLGMAEDVLRIAGEHDNEFALSCNVLLALVQARQVDGTVPVGLQLKGAIYSDVRKSEIGMELAGELDFQFVCHGPEYCTDPSFVEFAHERGLAVRSSAPAGGPSEELLAELESAGADHVVSDSVPEQRR